MDRIFAVFGAASGFIAVAAGAFGAHALKARLSPEMLAAFDTGARYQMAHALALLAVAWAAARWPGRAVAASGWCAARPSGTENIYKIYAESFKDEDHLQAIVSEARQIVDKALTAGR